MVLMLRVYTEGVRQSNINEIDQLREHNFPGIPAEPHVSMNVVCFNTVLIKSFNHQ